MKRPIILLGLAVLFGLVIAGTLSGCLGGGLNGVYEAERGGATYDFKSGSKVIISAGGSSNEMKYKIQKDKVAIINPLYKGDQGIVEILAIKDKNTLYDPITERSFIKK